MAAEVNGEGVEAAVDVAAAPPNENAVGCVAVLAVPNSDDVLVGLEVSVELPPKGEGVAVDDAVAPPNKEGDAVEAFNELPNVGAEAVPIDALPKRDGVVVVGAGVAPNNELDVVAVEAVFPNNGADVGVVVCAEPKGEEVVAAPPNKGVELAG